MGCAVSDDAMTTNLLDDLRARNEMTLAEAASNVCQGAAAWPIWGMIGWNDVRQKYRRSVLGPFWITLSMAIFISGLGIVYSRIFNAEIDVFLPYLGAGLIAWTFIASSMLESCNALQEAEAVIKQIRIPISAFVFRVIWRNFIVFMHTIVLIVPIWLVFGIRPDWTTSMIVPGLLLLCANLLWIGHVLSIACARFRDITVIVATILQLAIFITPIMFPVSALGPLEWVAQANPLYHMVALIRAPLIGDTVSPLTWMVAVGMFPIGMVMVLLLLRHTSHRIVYWL
jgi:ABC-type polysaccharide/polyol phosphate export permease